MNKPIIIMAAMENEADFLIHKLNNKSCQKINQYELYEGTIQDYPVVVCCLKVGTIHAAVATYIAIEKYHPLAILSEGTAGAHSKEIHIGDIIIGEKCINITSFRTPLKKEGEGSNCFEWEPVNFISGEEDRLKYQQGDSYLIKLAKQVEYQDGKVYFGTIGSGDIWNKEADRILWFNKNFGTLCEEMEGISIYKIANNFDIPVLGIRIISNNELLGETYDRNTGLKSQEFTYEIILKLISEQNQ